MPATEIAGLLGIIVAVVAIGKAGWAVAQFFVGLSEGLKNLTAAVTTLAERFDDHAQVVQDDLSDMRERVAGLESWRESEERAA